MLVLKVVYNEGTKSIVESLSKYNGCCFYMETYDEDHYKEKKLGFKIKGSCSAKKLPFVAAYDNGNLVKAFYSEADECRSELILKWIYDYLMEHAKKGTITITKVEGVNNDINYIGDSHYGSTVNFIEGLPLHLGTVSHWYHTSNVIEIDWEANRFKTMNSTYSFKFNENPSN